MCNVSHYCANTQIAHNCEINISFPPKMSVENFPIKTIATFYSGVLCVEYIWIYKWCIFVRRFV